MSSPRSIDPVQITPDDQPHEAVRSSVKLDINAKGAAQPKISVYEGTTEEEMQRIKDIAIRTLEVTLNELRARNIPVAG